MSVGEVSFGEMSFDLKAQNKEKHPNIKNIDLIFFLKEHSFKIPLFFLLQATSIKKSVSVLGLTHKSLWQL